MVWGLIALALAFGVMGLWLLLPERLTVESAPAEAVFDETPRPLVKGRGLKNLALNTFPSMHDRRCTCNGIALVWQKDQTRNNAWVAFCKRCGLARVDLWHGEVLEII